MSNGLKTITKPSLLDLLLIAFTALIWASAFTAIKVAVPETGALWLASARVLIGFLILLPICLTMGFEWPSSKSQAFYLFMVVLLNMAIPFVLISWGQNGVKAGVGALLMGTGPFIALVLSHFFTHDDRITGLKFVAMLLGMAGVATIMGPDAISGLGDSKLLSQLAIMAGAICYVIAGLFMRRISMKPIPFTTVALATGSAILIPTSLLIDGIPDTNISMEAIFALVWLGALPTGLAYVLRYMLIQKVGVSTFSLGMTLVPVLGVVLGVILLDEALTLSMAIALGLIMAGLFVARAATRRP